MYLKRSTFCILAICLWLLPGCSREPKESEPHVGTKPPPVAVPIYRLAVHPLHNSAKLMQTYQPLIDYLNSRLHGAQLSLESSRDYTNFEEKFLARKPEFILPNPWQTLQAIKAGYHVIAMAGDPGDFKGIFLIRRDSGINKPSDLKDKAVSYPSRTALAACIMPQYFLHTHGINVNTDIDNRYVGSQESSIMNVYLGTFMAGATWPTPWRAFQKEHPQEAAQLKVIWETETFINNSVMVRDDVPVEVANQVKTLLLGVNGTAEGKVILSAMETARFLPAADVDYEVVRRYISRFEREVRPVDQR